MNTQCPECKGRGKITVTMQEWGKPETKTSYDIDCIYCEGAGVVSQQMSEDIKADQDIWCKCEDQSDIYFMDDGECDCGIYKHHYHCSVCDKIVQIG